MILGIIGLIFAIFVGAAIIYYGWQAVVMFTYADSVSEFFSQVWNMLTSSWVGIVVIVFVVLVIIGKLQEFKDDFIEGLHDDKDDD